MEIGPVAATTLSIMTIAAALLLATLAFAVALLIAAVLAAVGGASDPWDLPIGSLGQAYLGTLISTFQGVAFGLLLLNTPAAIVVVVFPLVFGFA